MKKIILKEGTSVLGCFFKEYIRDIFRYSKDGITIDEDIYDLKDRIITLKAKAKRLAEEHKSSSFCQSNTENLGWEKVSEAVERGKVAPPTGWILPGVLPEGKIYNLMAPEKVGKSLLAMQIAIDCASGTSSMLLPGEWLENKQPIQRVFLYDAEMADDDIKERYEGIDVSDIYRVADANFDTPEELFEHIKATVFEGDPDNTLVIIDNVTAICPAFTEQKIKRLKFGLKDLQDTFVSKGYRLTFIIVHHTKARTTDCAGSINWPRLADMNLSLSYSNHKDQTRWLRCQNSRSVMSKLQEDEALLLKLEDKPYPHFEFVRTEDTNGATSVQSGTQVQPVSPGVAEGPKKSWVLNEEEQKYVNDTYDPGAYGYRQLAKDILQSRGWELDEKSINQVKNVVKRFLEQKPKE